MKVNMLNVFFVESRCAWKFCEILSDLEVPHSITNTQGKADVKKITIMASEADASAAWKLFLEVKTSYRNS